jgi:hypothetical protein
MLGALLYVHDKISYIKIYAMVATIGTKATYCAFCSTLACLIFYLHGKDNTIIGTYLV